MTRTCKALLVFLFLAAVVVRPVAAQTGLNPVILKPRPGSILQGMVTITGSSDVPGFFSSEIAFAYAGDTTGTWFLVAEGSQPVEDGTLAMWDTTTITDGDYVLRLRVTLADGSYLDATVPNLRVRNYTPVETPTPAPTARQATPLPTSTPTVTPFPTPTPLPHNPAVLTPADVSVSVAYGGLAAVLLLLVLGIYLWLRRK